MEVVFVKTAKGREEVDTKAGGLAPAMRRVLIYINGSRTINELRQLPRIENIESVLQALQQQGYIEPESQAAHDTVKAAQAAALPVVSSAAQLSRQVTNSHYGVAFRPLPWRRDPTQLQMTRNFMINTLNVFVGSFAVTALTKRLQDANEHNDLRNLFDEWYEAINTTREGRREADKLRSKLLEII